MFQKHFISKKDEDDCKDCRVGLGVCNEEITCLADKCGNSCRYDLKECDQYRENWNGIECAPNNDGFGFTKIESSKIDCIDWNRRQVSHLST